MSDWHWGERVRVWIILFSTKFPMYEVVFGPKTNPQTSIAKLFHPKKGSQIFSAFTIFSFLIHIKTKILEIDESCANNKRSF